MTDTKPTTTREALDREILAYMRDSRRPLTLEMLYLLYAYWYEELHPLSLPTPSKLRAKFATCLRLRTGHDMDQHVG